LVVDAHAQRIIGSGGIIIPLHEFKRLSCWHYREQKFKNYDYEAVTHGMTSIPNFINFRQAIL
jgi:hypothetical protein